MKIYPKDNTNTPVFRGLPNGYTKVDEYLVRGPHPSVRNLLKLKDEGVNQIYDFRHLSNFGCKFIEKFACRMFGIKYKRVPYSNLYGEYPSLSDFENISKSVKQNGENGGRTLFHCRSGRHRTSHFSAFYLLTRGEPLEDVQSKNMSLYRQNVDEVIKSQIVDKDYFSRSHRDYDGYNPIVKVLVEYNNKIDAGLRRAHKCFMNMISEIKA